MLDYRGAGFERFHRSVQVRVGNTVPASDVLKMTA